MDDIDTAKSLPPDRAPVLARREDRVRKGFWETFRKAARYIPFAEDVVAAYFCALDPDTPPRVKGILLAALAYFILPLDFVPDFIAAVGFGDDVAVLAAAISAIRPHMNAAHYAKARKALDQETAG